MFGIRFEEVENVRDEIRRYIYKSRRFNIFQRLINPKDDVIRSLTIKHIQLPQPLILINS